MDDVEVEMTEVYFLIMHFLSKGPCQRASGQLWNELLQHKLLPRRYHGLYSRQGLPSGDEDDDGQSLPLSYQNVADRYPHIDSNHLVKLLKQLFLHDRAKLQSDVPIPTAADVPTLLGSGAFSLLESEQRSSRRQSSKGLEKLRWPHWQAGQVHALTLRELGGGFSRHHRAPSTQTPKYVIVKPSVLVDRITQIKLLRGHRNAVYCAIFDQSGQYVITGSDDRLVKIWSTETGFCLRSCRGHEGDITELAVSIGNSLVASASNDFSIRVWRLPDGMPISVLRGHIAGVTAIAFSPRHGCEHHLLSSSEDGTCRIWDARDSSIKSRVYMPRPPTEGLTPGAVVQPASQVRNQILCCAFNADGTIFVTGSSDKLARVWDARKWSDEGRLNHELDILSGHENVVNYVQFSGCAIPMRPTDAVKEENAHRFKNSCFGYDSIVTCSKDGSAIIWTSRSRKLQGRWTKAYHLLVPPPPMPPQTHTRVGGPRQRLQQAVRGVNMIVWSLDNRFVLAAIMDCRICVWNAVDGSVVHCLTGHNKQTYVLDVHPYNPRIAMSAGYDGRVIIWDIWEGRPVRTYETAEFNLVDGKFSPDGTSLIVSDEVGQIYLFATGLGASQKDALYDQFFLGDFRPLVRDTFGNVLDQETQLPPHQRNLQDLLCDANLIPYPEPYQSTYQQRRLGALGIDWRPPSVQLAVGTMDDPAYLVAPDVNQGALVPVDNLLQLENGQAAGNRWVEQPADVDAMDWDHEVAGMSEDSGSDYCASEESLSEDELDGAGESDESTYRDSTGTEAEEADYEDSGGFQSVHTRSKRKEVDEAAIERKAKRLKAASEVVISDRRPTRRRTRHGSPSEQSARPMRLAARNALTMFSSLKNDDEEEAIPHADAEQSEKPSSSGERLLLTAKCSEEELQLTTVHEEAAQSRKPRSHRRLILKVSNGGKSVCNGSGIRNTEGGTPENVSGSHDNQVGCNDFSSGDNGDSRRRWKGKRARIIDGSSSDRSEKNADKKTKTDGLQEIAESAEDHSNNKLALVVHSEEEFKQVEAADDWRVQNNELAFVETLPEDDSNRQPAEVEHSEDSQQVETADDVDENVQSDEAPSQTLKLRIRNSNGRMNGTGVVAEACEELVNHFEEAEDSPQNTQTPEDECRADPDYSQEETQDNGNSIPSENDASASQCDGSGEDYKDESEDVSVSDDEDEDEDEQRWRKKRKEVPIKKKRQTQRRKRAEARRSKRMRRLEKQPERTYRRRKRSSASTSSFQESSYDQDGEGSDWGDRRGDLTQRRRSSTRLKQKKKATSSSGAVVTRSNHYHSSRLQARRKSREPQNVSWLLLAEAERGERYIPQFGDYVVYFRQGHQDFLEQWCTELDEKRGPWDTYKNNLLAVEFCQVVDLQYVIQESSANTCCRIILEIGKGNDRLCGERFEITLPELTDFPDFLVERNRYKASVERNWRLRDKCQVWWRSDEDEDGGKWWEGRIVEIKAHTHSPWDKFRVLYKDDSAHPHWHSPWELYDLEDSGWDSPHIDENTTQSLIELINQVHNSTHQSKDEYGLWRLQQAVSKPDFLDRIALPLTMEIMKLRLENRYYRSVRALKHDLDIFISNFRSYFGEDNSSVLKLERLMDLFDELASDDDNSR